MTVWFDLLELRLSSQNITGDMTKIIELLVQSFFFGVHFVSNNVKDGNNSKLFGTLLLKMMVWVKASGIRMLTFCLHI